MPVFSNFAESKRSSTHCSSTFDTKTFSKNELLSVIAPPPPKDFHDFWRRAYDASREVLPNPRLKDTGKQIKAWRVIDVTYQTTGGIALGGWLLLPKAGPPKRGFIVGHGYGGRIGPDFHFPFTDAAIFFPCCRGLARSPAPPISPDPQWHVLHDIDKKERYILRGCVEDTWLAVGCMEQLYPDLKGRLGYLGISFTGGVGAIAMAYEKRVTKAHFNVPTFGHHRLRLRMPTEGSGLAVQKFFLDHPRMTLKTLRYYDAANAVEAMNMPVHFALALRDHVVTPPGQFAIYNAVSAEKQLFVLDAGHTGYPNKVKQHKALMRELDAFFDY